MKDLHKKIRGGKTMLFLLTMSLFAPWNANAQGTNTSELTVNSGNTTNEYVPFYGYFVDYMLTSSQFIIPATTLGDLVNGQITKMTFHATQNTISWGSPVFKVYLTETNETTLSEMQDWASMTQVYEGVLSIADKKMVVEFDTLFSYLGGNLLVGFNQTALGSTENHSYWYGMTASGTSMSGYSGYISQQNFLPKTTFTYIPTAYPRVNPVLSNITPNSVDFTWTSPSGNVTGYQYQYKASTENWPSGWNTIEATATSLTILNLTALTDYDFRIKVLYGENESVTAEISFTTTCDYVELPFVDDLESYSGTMSGSTNNLPQCWNYINTSISYNYAAYPVIYNNSSNSHSGNNYLCFQTAYYDYPRDEYAILPIVEDVSGLRIKFYARRYSSSYGGTIVVGVMTNPSDASTFVAVETIDPLSTSYEQYTVPFNGYSGNYIAIKMLKNTTTNCLVLVDDILVEILTDCEKPSDLAVVDNSITTNSVGLSWIAGGEETAWTIQYKAENATDWTTINNVTTNPYTLNGLTSNTNYQVRVATICNSGNLSSYCDPISFSTQCDPITDFPWSENFNNYPNSYSNSSSYNINNLPRCWNYINTSSMTQYQGCPVIAHDSYSSPENSYLCFYSRYGYDPQDQYAVLPPMDDLNGLRIRFHAKNNSNASSLVVGVMENPFDASTFVEVSTITLSWNNILKKYKVDFNGVTGNYIAFKMAPSTYNIRSAIVDDIVVAPIPHCEEPESLTLVEATSHSATISWTNDEDLNEWQVYVSTDNELPDEPANLYTTTSNPFTISGLVHETTYYAWVRVNCGTPGDYSDWSDPLSFTTDIPCHNPNNLTVSGITPHTAQLSWTSQGEESVWQICVNNDEGHLIDVNETNTYTLTGLSPATAYTVKMRANCGDTFGYSPWSNPIGFTTGIACPQLISLIVSDVASTYATLNWTSSGQETAWQICYNDGVDHFIDVTDNSYTITDLTPGTQYSVKMRANCGIEDGYSTWTNAKWFRTDLCDPEDKCNISYTANGTYGWYDAYIAIMDGETEIESLTLNEGSGELALCPGEYSMVWYGYYDGEGSFTIYGSDGSELFSSTQFDELEYEQLLGSFEHVCEGVCFPPKNVDAWASTTSATMTWDQGGDEEQWKLSLFVNDSWTEPVTVNETSYDFDSLSPGTAYKARVKAVCGSDNESEWKETTFITPLCDFTCQIRYVLEDEYNDGWDGAHISVVCNSNNMEVAQLTVTEYNSPLTGYLPLCPGETYSFIWAGGYFDDECSFTIYGSDWTTIIVSHEAGEEIDDGEVLYGSYEHSCEGCEIFEISYDTPYIEDFNNTCWNTWGTNDPPYNYCSPSLWGGANGVAGVQPGCYTSSYLSLRPVKVTPTTQLTFRAWVEVWPDMMIGTSTVLVSTNNGQTWNPIGQAFEGGDIVDVNDEIFKQISTKTISLGDYAQYDFILVGFRYQGFSDNNNQISPMAIDRIRIYDPNVFEGNAKSASWSDDNNWTQGVPSEGDYVLINGDCNLDTDADLSSLIVNEGKMLTIQSGKTMTTLQASTSNVSQLVIMNGGQFVTTTPALATVKKFINGYDNGGGWNLIASPIHNSITPVDAGLITDDLGANTTPTTAIYDLYSFNQSPGIEDGVVKEWRNYRMNSFSLENNSSWHRVDGYLYANKNDVTLSFAGSILPDVEEEGTGLRTGVVYLSYADEPGGYDLPFRGWNLVGNPFTFKAYVDRSYYKMNETGTAITAVSDITNPENRINPCTGIMVEASEEDECITFSRDLSKQRRERGNLNIVLSQAEVFDNAVIDNAIISFNEGAQLSKFYLDNSKANIFIPQNDKDYAVACSEGKGEMLLNFVTKENGSYTLSFNSDKVRFDYLHLIDNITGLDIDLLQTPSYTFKASMTDSKSRFKLVFVGSEKMFDGQQ